jgi:hypothetical protein
VICFDIFALFLSTWQFLVDSAQSEFWLIRNPFFLMVLYFLSGCLECDPLSPPEGEAAQGEHPLTPPVFRVFPSFLVSLRYVQDPLGA